MTGRINVTPEAEQQLDELDDWITDAVSGDVARGFVSAILDHIDSLLLFPFAGQARDDVRSGMRTTTYRNRTLIAYLVDESSDELVVHVLGVFHGGQDWNRALSATESDREADR